MLHVASRICAINAKAGAKAGLCACSHATGLGANADPKTFVSGGGVQVQRLSPDYAVFTPLRACMFPSRKMQYP